MLPRPATPLPKTDSLPQGPFVLAISALPTDLCIVLKLVASRFQRRMARTLYQNRFGVGMPPTSPRSPPLSLFAPYPLWLSHPSLQHTEALLDCGSRRHY